MKTTATTFFAVAVLCLAGCNLMGPPLYENHAEEYLSAHGFGTDAINAVLAGTAIPHELFVVLAAVPDISVRHMLGRNLHLSRDERHVLLQDSNEFVRQGVAMNQSLSREEISLAMADPSFYVWKSLAMNPSVPEDVLLRLRSRPHVSLTDFAQNTHCPEAIVREIEESNDSLAKQLLDTTRRVHGGPRALTPERKAQPMPAADGVPR